MTVSARARRRRASCSRVEDTGVGIDASDLARIGDPFFQARGSYARPYDGTGLGLSIVKGLVGAARRHVEIRSRVGEGTCITVRLPVDCEKRRVRERASPGSAARRNTVQSRTTR